MTSLTSLNSGFVAGTLVHTDQGLVPIEQIKVGDIVLSRHESCEGTLEYKRVTKTFKSAEEKVLFAVWYTVNGSPLERLLICTKDHPFWIEGKGWVAARAIDASFKHGYGAPIIFSDGKKGEIVFALEIVKTLEKNICYLADYDWHRRPGSMMFDFRQTPIRLASTFTDLDLYPTDQFILAKQEETDFYGVKLHEALKWVDEVSPYIQTELPYEAVVYNIEVDGFHTYFVGEAGVQVNDNQDYPTHTTTLPND